MATIVEQVEQAASHREAQLTESELARQQLAVDQYKTLHRESLKPDITSEQDITLAGQRKVNLIWEYTQAFIAVITLVSCMLVGVYIGIKGQGDFPQFLSSTAFLVVGFYFGRTNHQNIGGIGPKANIDQTYLGR